MDVDGVRYFITYQYNAETEQFSTGNDVRCFLRCLASRPRSYYHLFSSANRACMTWMPLGTTTPTARNTSYPSPCRSAIRLGQRESTVHVL